MRIPSSCEETADGIRRQTLVDAGGVLIMPVHIRLTQNLSPSRRNGLWDSTTGTRRTSVRADCCSRLACCIPSASLHKSYLLRKKRGDQVVSNLKLKLKTSPT